MAFGSIRERFYAFEAMFSYEKRLQSFEDWPFREDCLCTPEQMAKMGFVHCPSENSPDTACCFICLKELEGWEPQDDPRQEHSKRTPNCPVLLLEKKWDELTVGDYLNLNHQRFRFFITKWSDMKMDEFREKTEETLSYIKNL
ncbi:baculoviral IAP repeat-containing protein 5b [Engraulis encrasicolus]|uniref:baculoviral IAP repeat-containing protein 5b n=1 Tax=Engraulis encrasicolus TaxID=184585 RepID=UPI002FD4AD79